MHVKDRINKRNVFDHNHFTGEYRGAAHNQCNMNCKKTKILPVILHNLQGYDSHLFIKEIGKLNRILKCIPSTEQNIFHFLKRLK